MVKMLSLSFETCISSFTMLLGQGSPKTESLDIYLTIIFGVRKSKNISAMRVIFFLKDAVDAYHSERLFRLEFYSHGSINMVKMLSFSFEQCFDTFTMLLVERSSETGLFKLLTNPVFRSPWVRKYIHYEAGLFFESFQNWI